MTEKRQLSLNRNTKLSRSNSNVCKQTCLLCEMNFARTMPLRLTATECKELQGYERLQRLGLGLLEV